MTKNKHLKKVKHDIIRYANCWEDADVLLAGLSPMKGSKILSIGSGGDNSFSLLTTNPKLVIAIDINITQLHIIHLKKASFKYLSYEAFLALLGFTESDKRRMIYDRISHVLPKECNTYWLKNFDLIESGLIHSGKFEKYFQTFRKKVLPLVHSQTIIEKLFEQKSKIEQEEFYQKIWNNLRWQWIFKIFFSKFVMGTIGRDPAFLKEVNLSVHDFIFQQAENHLKSTECQSNYFLKYIMTGNFGDNLPHYARKENFEKIKSNIDKLEVSYGLASSAFEKYDKFDSINFSDIFEYMDKSTFRKLGNEILNHLESDGKIAYWNLMVPRTISSDFPSRITKLNPVSEELTKIDKGFFYGSFIVEQKLSEHGK